MYSYNGKMLFVDLTDRSIREEILDERTARDFIGGPSLGAKVLFENMPAKADVFGRDSMIGFVTGPLNDTGALFGGRYTVVSKSPVTGGWNDSNSGGYFGQTLKRSGYDAVFVNGISDDPVYIFIDNGIVSLLDASVIWGKNTIETEKWLKSVHGDDINAALIGRGGEKMSHLACVMNDSHRAAGRGGSGAVMGSKLLKAVVVKGDHKTEIASREALLEANRTITEFMKGQRGPVLERLSAMGTGMGFDGSIMSGDAGVKNFAGSGFKHYPDSIGHAVGSPGLEQFKKKQYRCSTCPVGCGAILDIPDDRWDLSDSPRPEYETQGGFGSMLLNTDPAVVSRCNDLCNEYGIDTISTAGTVAWAMECYNEGILSAEELDGIELTWGNGDAIVAITENICECRGAGAVLANGSRAAARAFGKGFECLVTSSGIEEAMHDSRYCAGAIRTYQYDPTPGRHVKGGLGLRPTTGGMDYSDTGEKDKAGMIGTEIMNATGYCLIGTFVTLKDHILPLFCATTGFEYTAEEAANLGLRSFTYRHAFNLREGLSRKDFTVDDRLIKGVPGMGGPLEDVVVDNEKLADNFFEAMHWDKTTLIPARESLEAIGGCGSVIKELYGE